MNGTTAVVSSTVLTDSIDSLGSARLGNTHHHHLHGNSTAEAAAKRAAAQISRAYKQASQFFLQRRFPECLFTVQPLITRKTPEGKAPTDEGEPSIPAPIASASRAARVKVWSLYITLLNSIVELGPEDGKNQFGNVQWRVMERKVRDGSIWEDVVQNGYGGMEGNVDPDVVSNLATLLLSQAPNQTLTQQRLETYLAASNQPNLDVSSHFDANGTPTSTKRNFPPASPYLRSGTDTPRDLNSRIKILELYALHVLPRNEEWAYAKDFVSMSPVLDDDTREEFLQTLAVLEDEQRLAGVRERELNARAAAEEKTRLAVERQRMEEAQLERSSQGSGARRPSSSAGGGASGRNGAPLARTDSERDYGIDDDPAFPPAAAREPSPPPRRPPPPDKAPGPSSLKRNLGGGSSTRLGAQGRRSGAAGRRPLPPQTLAQRGAALMAQLQRWVAQMATSASKNPTALVQTLLFMVALILALARQDVRLRLTRLLGQGWEKLLQTLGMGVKVSYI